MQDTAVRREQILDAALEVFAEKGFHRATMAEVAEKARVAKGTVYLYFEGKEALLVTLFDTLVDGLIRALDQILSDDVDPREAVRRWVAQQLGSTRTGRLISQLLMQHPFLSSLSLQRERRFLLDRAVRRVASRVRAAVEAGTIRAIDATLTACVLLSLPAMIPLYGARHPDLDLVDAIPQMAEGLTDILWSGLRMERNS